MPGLQTTRYAALLCCLAFFNFSWLQLSFGIRVACLMLLNVNQLFGASYLLRHAVQLEIPVQVMLLGDTPLLLDL